MPKKPKNPAPKRVLVIRKSPALKPEDKPTYAHDIKNQCANSPVYNASTPLQGYMAAWITAADALTANQASQAARRTELGLAEAAEPALIVACDNGEATFATAVGAAATGDVTVATNMGMSVHAEKAPSVSATVPTGVRVTRLKTTGAPKLMWDGVPGAKLYLAQMSVDPATDASWSALYGPGKGRPLPPLVPGQHYLFRVAALDNSGKPTGWSATVSFVG